MKQVATKLKSIWSDESAQGATEYILLLVVVVGVVMVFGPEIKGAMQDKIKQLKDGMAGITTSP